MDGFAGIRVIIIVTTIVVVIVVIIVVIVVIGRFTLTGVTNQKRAYPSVLTYAVAKYICELFFPRGVRLPQSFERVRTMISDSAQMNSQLPTRYCSAPLNGRGEFL